MDQEEHKVLAGQFDRETNENLSSSINGTAASESMTSMNSEKNSTFDTGENGALEALGSDLGSSKVVMNRHEQIFNQEDIDRCSGGDVPHRVVRGANEDLCSLGGGIVPEIVIVNYSNESLGAGRDDRGLEARISEPVLGKVSTKGVNKMVTDSEKTSCVIDVKCSSEGYGENPDVDCVCRICHLGSEQSSHVTVKRITGDVNMMTMTDLIQLGCGCKDELGIAHSYCAEAWFKIRGNRLCEICGKTVKNITGFGDNGFMEEEWNGRRRSIGGSSNSSNRGRGCWRGQPFCNFLMACLVMGFVLPWFFHVNMF